MTLDIGKTYRTAIMEAIYKMVREHCVDAIHDSLSTCGARVTSSSDTAFVEITFDPNKPCLNCYFEETDLYSRSNSNGHLIELSDPDVLVKVDDWIRTKFANG